MPSVCLEVSVPICSFRRAYAREFLESERIPPPSTVYGFLLSLVGESDRRRYVGTRIALAIIEKPERSIVLRTAWRVKNRTVAPGVGNNKRPDYQEVLTGLVFGVWVGEGDLAERINDGFTGLGGNQSFGGIERFGGLSLGESHDLVDSVLLNPNWDGKQGKWLTVDDAGEHPLPVWVDHVGSKGTRWTQFKLEDGPLETPSLDDPKWVIITPPGAEHG